MAAMATYSHPSTAASPRVAGVSSTLALRMGRSRLRVGDVWTAMRLLRCGDVGGTAAGIRPGGHCYARDGFVAKHRDVSAAPARRPAPCHATTCTVSRVRINATAPPAAKRSEE